MTAPSDADADADADLPVSRAEGRQLCGLFVLTLTDGTPVATGALAARLGLSGATVTETIKRFDDDGLVSYEPYVGAKLTARGEAIARRLLWRRCVVQDFFETTAGVSLDPTTAYRVGRAVSASDLARLDEGLTRPCAGRCEADDRPDCDRLTG
jgi:DtxR family Mn-dependent transcriptional regulator